VLLCLNLLLLCLHLQQCARLNVYENSCITTCVLVNYTSTPCRG
jgi:hypothetical protein